MATQTTYKKSYDLNLILNILLITSLSMMVFYNYKSTFNLGKRFRYYYGAKRQEVVNLVKNWSKKQPANSKEYFIVTNCPGNDLLTWFDNSYVRKNSGWENKDVYLVDALWPEKSLALNKENLDDRRDFSIMEIKCKN
ncbi:MAG: hypothetical protein P1U74_00095 [Legionellaceae bacterium]|nr:hypothetical protein [Legionellaceae bacterium]